MTRQTRPPKDVPRNAAIMSWLKDGQSLEDDHEEEETMTADEAIQIIALHALSRQTDTVSESWDAYPEIGEHDWERVVDAASALVPQPTGDEFAQAYDLLAKRADPLSTDLVGPVEGER